ncbi:MAG: hypothetical protein IPO80_04595 [Propionibacteriaceae bacterium]|nr:hypothetical protein [Propionibacteriaceae bacterium]
MNADIAAAGIGIAVIFEPNRKFIDAVLRGQDAARSRRGGPLQQSARIHPPAQVEQAAAQLETLSTELSATSGEVAIVLAGVDSALLAAQATRLSLERTDDPIHAGAYEAVRGDLRTRLQGAIQHGESMRTWLALEHQRLAKAERRAERKAAEAEAARRAVAREAAEREAAERRREGKEAADHFTADVLRACVVRSVSGLHGSRDATHPEGRPGSPALETAWLGKPIR